MKEDITNMVSQFESGQISRRELVGNLTALVALVTGGAGVLRAQESKASKPKAAGKPLFTAEDRKPFEEIARRKGVKLRVKEFDAAAAGESKFDENKIHLDMDMVEESIRSAIKTTSRAGTKSTQGKLERLLKSGTDAQKVELVLGSGTYYFPEDIENLAKLSRLSGGMPLKVDCRRVCETLYFLVCRCRSLFTETVQECKDEAREYCDIRCYPD
jgi:hypothetical protein